MEKTKDLLAGQPSKPVGLTERASAYWDRLIRELKDSGIELTPGHRAWLEMAVTIGLDIADAAARVKKDGAYVEDEAAAALEPFGPFAKVNFLTGAPSIARDIGHLRRETSRK